MSTFNPDNSFIKHKKKWERPFINTIHIGLTQNSFEGASDDNDFYDWIS